MRRRDGRISGFTLLELLVVIAIMGVTSTMGMIAFFRMNSLWTETKGRTEMDREADKALKSIRQDLAEIVAPGSTGVPLAGTAANVQDERFWGATLANDRIEIPVAGMKRVTYAIDRGKDSAKLVRKVGPLFGGGEPLEQEIASGVLQMRIEYAAASGAWQKEWDGDTLPEAVRVSLSLVHPSRDDEQIARKAAFPINVD